MRTLDILTYVSGSRRPVTPKAISEALNIPLAGTNDILDTMVRMEYLMQPDKGVRAFAVGIRAFEAGAAYIPVSYTHLDVYKRQIQRSPYTLR